MLGEGHGAIRNVARGARCMETRDVASLWRWIQEIRSDPNGRATPIRSEGNLMYLPDDVKDAWAKLHELYEAIERCGWSQ